VVVFIDGDFWHGYRFSRWQHKIPEFWKCKIRGNRERDRRNFARLRKMGWKVIRIWQHELEADAGNCILRIMGAVETRA
jgi:DNA mismatch endonuclease (patch repair protein)